MSSCPPEPREAGCRVALSWDRGKILRRGQGMAGDEGKSELAVSPCLLPFLVERGMRQAWFSRLSHALRSRRLSSPLVRRHNSRSCHEVWFFSACRSSPLLPLTTHRLRLFPSYKSHHLITHQIYNRSSRPLHQNFSSTLLSASPFALTSKTSASSDIRHCLPRANFQSQFELGIANRTSCRNKSYQVKRSTPRLSHIDTRPCITQTICHPVILCAIDGLHCLRRLTPNTLVVYA